MLIIPNLNILEEFDEEIEQKCIKFDSNNEDPDRLDELQSYIKLESSTSKNKANEQILCEEEEMINNAEIPEKKPLLKTGLRGFKFYSYT